MPRYASLPRLVSIVIEPPYRRPREFKGPMTAGIARHIDHQVDRLVERDGCRAFASVEVCDRPRVRPTRVQATTDQQITGTIGTPHTSRADGARGRPSR